MKKIFSILILLPFFFGCSGLPLAERQNNATTEVSEKWSRNQHETIKVAIGAASQSNQPASVEWTADNSENGNGDQSLATELENTIPGGIKMVYAACGIGALILVVGWLRRSSAAANAVFSMADKSISNVIHRVEAKMQAAQSAEERAVHAATLSDLEKARGQAARRI